MNDGPKVFGDSDITIALSQDGQLKLFAGQKQIGYVHKLILETDVSLSIPKIEVHFPRSTTSDLEMQIESYARALSMLPWVRIVRL